MGVEYFGINEETKIVEHKIINLYSLKSGKECRFELNEFVELLESFAGSGGPYRWTGDKDALEILKELEIVDYPRYALGYYGGKNAEKFLELAYEIASKDKDYGLNQHYKILDNKIIFVPTVKK